MSCAAEIRRRAPDCYSSSLLRACILVLLPLLLISAAAGQPARKNAAGRLLIASDVHFNPMADPSLVADLAAADPSQWETILQRSKVMGFSSYGQDTNWWLLRSALDAMVRAEPHPALVMFTGDLLAHDFPKTYQSITHDSEPGHYRAFVFKTVDFVALEFRKRFVATKILLTPGNNDEYCGDYSIEANGAFLRDTAERARDLAMEGEQFSATWKSLGSYSLGHPTLHGLRILSLNTIFWSDKYRAASFSHGCATVNSTAASDLLTWLESQLAEAEQAHEKVWLMFHIPPGIDGWATTHPYDRTSAGTSISAASCASSVVPMWVPEWTARFDSLLERYRSTVLASFAGHTHVDDFRVIGADVAKQQFVLIDPAISPIYYQNPGFRIVDFNSDGTLADQTTYFLTNLKQAGGKTRGRWRREYTFSRRWKVPQLDGASLAKIYDEIATRNTARDLWLHLYMVSSSAAPIPAKDVKGLYCAIDALTQQAYESCYCAATVPEKPSP
ncbi:MAG: metallophosphoesterase [Candidatus Korobacteraceae bacterium]